MALSIKPLFASYNPLIASKRILQVTNSDHFSQNSLPSAHNLSIAHDHTLSLPLKHHNYRSKHYAVSFMCPFLKLLIQLMTIEKLSVKTISWGVFIFDEPHTLVGFTCVKRKNSRPITSWHIILPSPQNTTNYKAPRIIARFCYHYLKTNKKFPSVMQNPITYQRV